MRINLFNTFIVLNCIKVINSSSLFQILAVCTKECNDECIVMY